MSTPSDVANAQRWLADAQAARDRCEAKIENLKGHVNAAEADLEALTAAAKDAKANLARIRAELLVDEQSPDGSATYAQAETAAAEGSAE